MSQAQLAEDSGVSRSAIKGYETGRNMPGARELKLLCRVLKVSPNVLLFGTETPFGDGARIASMSPGLQAMLNDPVDAKVARLRLTFLGQLLTSDEVASLMNIIQALAVARHGTEVVQQAILGADLYAGVGAQLTEGALAGKVPSPEEMAEGLSEHLARQGHVPKGR